MENIFHISNMQQFQRYIVFGSGGGLDYFCNKYLGNSVEKIKCIVDNDSNKWGTTWRGVPICNPEILHDERIENVFVFVASDYHEEIKNQLDQMGLEEEKNYWIPIDFKKRTSKGRCKLGKPLYPSNELLISCIRETPGTGGLFTLDTQTNEVSRIRRGSHAGICLSEDNYIVGSENDLVILDKQYLTIRDVITVSNAEKSAIHGVVEYKDMLIVALTTYNTLLFIDKKTFKVIDKIVFEQDTHDIHHINDLAIQHDTLYVSMLSLRIGDAWMHNGAIMEFDLTRMKPKSVICNGLSLPHTLKFIDNQLYFCDSGSFRLATLNETVVELNGFTRGLEFDGRYFYIGQSKWRDMPETWMRNISMDCGIYIFDPVLRLSRFVHIPSDSQNVYAIHKM